MSERYELSTPFTPLGAPSPAYRDGWDRVFGRRRRPRGRGRRKSSESRGLPGGRPLEESPEGASGAAVARPAAPAGPTPQGTSAGAVASA
jgi:hypothetical protein